MVDAVTWILRKACARTLGSQCVTEVAPHAATLGRSQYCQKTNTLWDSSAFFSKALQQKCDSVRAQGYQELLPAFFFYILEIGDALKDLMRGALDPGLDRGSKNRTVK